MLSAPDPFEALRRTAGLAFDQAKAMPPEVYTSAVFLDHELEYIFRRDWYCMGRASALAKPGDYLTGELAGQPLVVVRGADGDLKAMANVCLHRMSTLLSGTGNARRIVCPYHAWTYNLDGTLRSAPQMTRSAGFCKEDYKLPELRCEQWLGWIYVSQNRQAEPVSDQLAALQEMVEIYGMEDYVETFRETHVWETNWKVLAENFMESYHLPVCHRATVGPYTSLEDVDCPPGHPGFNIHWFPKEADLAIGNAHPHNTRMTGDWRKTSALIAIYPGHLITLTPGYFWYLSLQPVGVGQVHMIFGGGFSPDFMADPKVADYDETLQSLLKEVNVEDRRCTEKVYRGLSAGLSKSGHLSHLERPLYDFAKYLVGRMDGAKRGDH